jgi:hypothetical protein
LFEGRIKHVKIILPIVILGCGKSYFFNRIHEKYTNENYISYLISSDELSWYMIEKAKYRMNYRTDFDYFNNSRKEYRQFYNASMSQLINRVMNVDHGDFCLLVDKNHHPFHFKKTKTEYEELLESLNVTYDFVLMYIKVENPLADNPLLKGQFIFPLNFKIFVDSFIRMNSRDNVLMKNYSEEQNLETLMLFFGFFCNFKYYNYRKSQNIFLTMYDESDKELAAIIDAELGPALAEYLIFERKGKKTDELGLGKQDYAKQFLEIWRPFYQKNKILLETHTRPSVASYDKSIIESEVALFAHEVQYPSEKTFDYLHISYFGVFFPVEFKMHFVREKFLEFHEILKKITYKKPEDLDIALKQTDAIGKEGLKEPDWVVPRHHFTIMWVNGKPVAEEDRLLIQGFEVNKEVSLKVDTCVFIPSRIAFFVLSSPKRRISQNTVPHITLMRQGKYSYRDSNEICEMLLKKNELKNEDEVPKLRFHSVKLNDLYSPNIKNDVYIFRFPVEVIKGRQRIEYL